MRRWWTRRWKTIGIVVGALAAIILGSLLLKKAGLDPNAFAAVASAAAAIAAFASARESSITARDAVRALSWAAKPIVNVEASIPELSEHYIAYLQNESMHPISEASVRWTLQDGRTGQRTYKWLKGRDIPLSNMRLVGHMGVHYPPIDHGQFVPPGPGHDVYEVDYRGANGPTTWPVRRPVRVSAAVERITAVLTARERLIPAFEDAHPAAGGSKEERIRQTFGFSAVRYHQLLYSMLDRQDAEAEFPRLIHRPRRLALGRSSWRDRAVVGCLRTSVTVVNQ